MSAFDKKINCVKDEIIKLDHRAKKYRIIKWQRLS